MKVLMTYHGRLDVNSGAAGSMVNIGKNLEALGAEVDYFTYDDLPKQWNFKLKHFGFPFFVNQHVQRYGKWDVVDACTGDSWVLGKSRNSSKRPKILIRSSGLEHMLYEQSVACGEQISWKARLVWGGLNLKLVELSLKSADCIIALTKREKKYIEAQFKIASDRVLVMPHVLPHYFRNLPVHSNPKKFKILYVGNWGSNDKRKGTQFLVQALEALSRTNFDFCVTLAGVRVEAFIIHQQLSAKLSKKTTVIPFIEHHALPELYRSHSVFVFPSLYEGFGKVITEAMAAGIPILTTSAGIAEELIQHGVNGLLIPYQNALAIYEALVWAIEQPEKTQLYGKQAQSLINQVECEEIYRQRIKLYYDLIKDKSPYLIPEGLT